MSRLALLTLASSLLGAYALLAVAAHHPHVSREYRDYYIDQRTVFWQPKRYEAELEQGIDLRREGLPMYVRNLSGVSYAERWGRWTDAKAGDGVRIEFNRDFVGDVCVEVRGRPSSSQLGQQVDLTFGTTTSMFRTSEPALYSYKRAMRLPVATNLLLIKPSSPSPAEWDPRGLRTRRVALAIESIRVRPTGCMRPQINHPSAK
jgi:hypothetical protein